MTYAFNGGPVAYVGLDEERSAPESFDRCDDLGASAVHGPVIDTDVGTGPGQLQGDPPADPSGSPGYQSDLPSQQHRGSLLTGTRNR